MENKHYARIHKHGTRLSCIGIDTDELYDVTPKIFSIDENSQKNVGQIFNTPCTPALIKSFNEEIGTCDCELLPDNTACTLEEIEHFEKILENEKFQKKKMDLLKRRELDCLKNDVFVMECTPGFAKECYEKLSGNVFTYEKYQESKGK